MRRLENKVAIITGAKGKIGTAQAKRFLEEGAKVLLVDLEAPSIGRESPDWLGIRGNVTQVEDWEVVAETALSRFGKIDILVNTAGFYDPKPMLQSTEAEMRNHFEVNQLGPFLGMLTLVPIMQRAGGGAIVNISSAAGLKGYPGMFCYSGSKWALRGMTKCASAEIAQFGIRVNSIHPGAIDTDMLKKNDPSMLAALEAMIPLGSKRGTAEDVAAITLFLASDEAQYITGAEVAVDGGVSV